MVRSHSSFVVSAAVGLLVMVGGLLPAVPAAAASAVRCGATLSTNTTLKRDLTCSGTGLRLLSGVSLDLGGHRLTGDGTGSAVQALASSGTVIRNGTLQGWGLGIEFEGATPYPDQELKLSRLVVRDAPVYLQAAVTRVDRSTFVRSELRLYENFFTATRSTFVQSSSVGELNRVTLRHSVVRGGGVGLDENNEVNIVDSTLDGSGTTGPAIGCSRANTIVGSTIRNYPSPVFVYAECPTTVDRSTFTGNGAGALVTQDSPSNLVVSRSTFRGNAFGVQGAGAQISASRFTRNGVGVDLTEGSGSIITASVFTDNDGAGIEVDSGPVRLGLNRAERNGGHGIYAPDAVDLGGNRARANGSTDCVGVTCGT